MTATKPSAGPGPDRILWELAMCSLPFHLLDPSPCCCPRPQARGPERQGQLFSQGCGERALYLLPLGTGSSAIGAEPEGSWHPLAVPVRSLICLSAQPFLKPSASGLPAPPATPALHHFLSVSFSEGRVPRDPWISSITWAGECAVQCRV